MNDWDALLYGIKLRTWAFGIALAVIGGVVGWFRKVDPTASRWTRVLQLAGAVVTSGFGAVMTFLLCSALGFNELLSLFMAGVAGHMGAEALDFFSTLFRDLLSAAAKRASEGKTA